MGNMTRGTARKTSSGVEFQTPEAADLTEADPPAEAKAEIAGYIAQLSAEMSHMAERAGLETLAYFLSMARLEAEMERRRTGNAG